MEIGCWKNGRLAVAGLDEAGRGAWAGPVHAGAVVLPADPAVASRLAGVRDSKRMTPRQRAIWAPVIQAVASAWGIGAATSREIDDLGILAATRLAMQRALEALPAGPQYLLVDALHLPQVDLPQQALIRGDSRSLSISAASVLAKVARDACMVTLDAKWPGYGFASHKGYGTPRHRSALQLLGPCSIHRQTFSPIRLALR